MRTVAIIGSMGYVGTGMANLFKKRFAVVRYDVRMSVDHNARRNECREADLVVICVPTPQGPNGGCDTTMVEEVVGWVSRHNSLIVIKSTIPPGTTDRLSAQFGVKLNFSPEYMGEPRNFVAPWKYPDPQDATSHPFVIVGGERAGQVLDYFQAVMAVDARYVACKAIEAELCKYMENSYFATKVRFCHEWSRIAETFGVSYHVLRELWLQDPRVERDHTAVFAEGVHGFNGKCLPKDLDAIIAASQACGYKPPLLSAVLETNRQEVNEVGDAKPRRRGHP